jgi:ribonucleoside-diphosphate reductase alpha chain
VRNKHLKELLEEKGYDNEEVWNDIARNEGSVAHLDFLNQHEKDLFKTAQEIDQYWVIEHAADRTPFITQAQSVNLFLPANIHKRDLHLLHFMAWKKGVKSLYYCRSTSLQRSEKVGNEASYTPAIQLEMSLVKKKSNDYEECLACQ